MLKLIIFDLDGVLVDLKDIHFDALNKALVDVGCNSIAYSSHIKYFDGLPTRTKLQKLEVDSSLTKRIIALKNRYTNENLSELLPDLRLRGELEKFIQAGYKLAVASNATSFTVLTVLKALGIAHCFSHTCGNDQVTNTKPHPEMYFNCMTALGVAPDESVIVEDSRVGREGAMRTGAFVVGIDEPKCLRFTSIQQTLCILMNERALSVKWAGRHDLTVLIPMAGAGSAFSKAGYGMPKPWIDVNGKPMIQRVIENLNIDAEYVFITQESEPQLRVLLKALVPHSSVLTVDGVTEGAAVTALLARRYINNNRHLLIANCDQLIEWDNSSSAFLYSMIVQAADGGIVTFPASDVKWSYVATEGARVVRVAEKEVIGPEATAGVYYWKHGYDFVRYAEQMIDLNIRTRGEFYICPVYNQAIQDGRLILNYPVPKVWGLGNPLDLEIYLQDWGSVPTYEDLY